MEPRHDLIRHLRQQIQSDPEAYANAAKLNVVARKLELVMKPGEKLKAQLKKCAEQRALERQLRNKAAWQEGMEREQAKLLEFLETEPQLGDARYLARLLHAMVDRIGTDLECGDWESPSAEDQGQAAAEMADLCALAWAAALHHGLVEETDAQA